MPLSKNIKNYQHIGQVLDAALKAGGGRYILPTEKAARRWRQEAYYYRKLFEEEQRVRLGFASGIAVRTPYDRILLTIEGTMVVIRERELEGQLRGEDGKVIPLEEPRKLAEDEPILGEDVLQEAAERLRQQLIGEGNGEDSREDRDSEGSDLNLEIEPELPDSLKRD